MTSKFISCSAKGIFGAKVDSLLLVIKIRYLVYVAGVLKKIFHFM